MLQVSDSITRMKMNKVKRQLNNSPVVRRQQKKPLVVLVETDELLIRMFLTCWQDQFRVHVVREHTLSAVLSSLDELSPNLIVIDLDIFAGDFDFTSLCELRQDTTCPVLVVASLIHEREAVAILDAGADACFDKPVSIQLLNTLMRALFHRTIVNRVAVRH